MQIFSQCCHLRVDLRLVCVIVLVLPLEGEGAAERAEGPVLLVGGLILLVLGLLPDEAVLVVVGDPDLGADDHHHVGHDLGVVNHDGLDGAVQHSHLQQPHLLSVLECVLEKNVINKSRNWPINLHNYQEFCSENLRDEAVLNSGKYFSRG